MPEIYDGSDRCMYAGMESGTTETMKMEDETCTGITTNDNNPCFGCPGADEDELCPFLRR